MARDCRHVSGETSCLVCVSVSRSDCRHNADSSLHAITKVPRILDTSTGVPGLSNGFQSAELESFSLSMCIDATEWLLRRGCRHYPCFGRRVEPDPVPCLELFDIFRQVPCFSAGASFLLRGFLKCPVLKILAHTDCDLDVHAFE